VRGATAERLRAFYERSDRADRMAVMVVGDLKPARVAEAIEREFSFPNQDGLVRERPFFPVRPAYAANVKFADAWRPAQAGTDAALAMAMGWRTRRARSRRRSVAVTNSVLIGCSVPGPSGRTGRGPR